MSCSPFDLRDYFLKELTDPQRRQVEAHVRTCQPCREELDGLSLTEAALFSLRDEEIPQRIAFVSDKIFEPSPWRRWWTAFWGSSARLGFASAALISAAWMVSAVTRPAPAPVPQPLATQAEIDQRIQKAVDRAVADVASQYAQKTEQLVKEIRQRDAQERTQIMQAAARQLDYAQHNELAMDRGPYSIPPERGEVK